jgi:alpha-ketoglutarate-dependent taurine dioxygenase
MEMETTDTAPGINVAVTQCLPFGVEVTAEGSDTDLHRLPVSLLKRWVAEHRVLILRGFGKFHGSELSQFCERLGTLQVFEFGTVDELRAKENSRNFIFTTAAVPFHWDGMFLEAAPSFQFFSCEEAPPSDTGGQTLFSDTTRVLARAPAATRRLWEQIFVTYRTEKVVYYGGEVTFPLVARHPASGETTLRFAEPVDTDLNPVWNEIHGLSPDQHVRFLHDLRERLYDPAVCLAHTWRPGDVVMTDNHALLHGRRAYTDPGRRHLRRVNIL